MKISIFINDGLLQEADDAARMGTGIRQGRFVMPPRAHAMPLIR